MARITRYIRRRLAKSEYTTRCRKSIMMERRRRLLLGPSSCGKTTLLSIISVLSSRRIVASCSTAGSAICRPSNNIARCLVSGHHDTMTVYDNPPSATQPRCRRAEVDRRVRETLMIDLSGWANRQAQGLPPTRREDLSRRSPALGRQCHSLDEPHGHRSARNGFTCQSSSDYDKLASPWSTSRMTRPKLDLPTRSLSCTTEDCQISTPAGFRGVATFVGYFIGSRA